MKTRVTLRQLAAIAMAVVLVGSILLFLRVEGGAAAIAAVDASSRQGLPTSGPAPSVPVTVKSIPARDPNAGSVTAPPSGRLAVGNLPAVDGLKPAQVEAVYAEAQRVRRALRPAAVHGSTFNAVSVVTRYSDYLKATGVGDPLLKTDFTIVVTQLSGETFTAPQAHIPPGAKPPAGSVVNIAWAADDGRSISFSIGDAPLDLNTLGRPFAMSVVAAD